MNTTVSTRRQFLAAGAVLPFAWRAMAQGHAAAPLWVLLGTDKGKGIYRARWDAAKGELGAVELAVETDRPDFFAMHPKLPVMYSVNSVGNGNGGVSSFSVDKTSGALMLTNRVSSRGDGPCAVSIDRSGKSAFVANYTGGSMAAYWVGASGTLTEAAAFDCRQNPVCGSLGPVKERQDAAHLHCVTLSPHDDFVLVCNLGEDAIEVFQVIGGTHPQSEPLRVVARSGSGPRHLAFHPNGKWLYCIHELDCTVDLYDWNTRSGVPEVKLRESSVISTLAKGTSLTGNTACEIFVSDDGRFVYTCTRGVDEIVVYRINQQSGLLTEHQRLSAGGKTPRYIALDPSRKWLVCCNQGAGKDPVGNVTVFAHDTATGKLSEKPKVFAAETPMFTLFV
jgi:6-phosphogluconolactonase